MIELPQQKSETVRSLIANEPPGFLIALATLGNPHGRIFVDNTATPKCALLLSPTGWHSALGSFDSRTAKTVSQVRLSSEAVVYLKEYEIYTSRLAMIGGSFEISIPEKASQREREMLILVATRNEPSHDPQDSQIFDLTLDGYKQAARFTPMLSKFWPNPNELIGKQEAKVFVEDGITKGICYTCFRSGECHEPHITIDEKYRGQGIGKLLTAAYTNSLLEQNQRIFWSHYPENIGSGRCAAAAGFAPYGNVKVIQCFTPKI